MEEQTEISHADDYIIVRMKIAAIHYTFNVIKELPCTNEVSNVLFNTKEKITDVYKYTFYNGKRTHNKAMHPSQIYIIFVFM